MVIFILWYYISLFILDKLWHEKILLFSLVIAFSSRADLCDDLFKKHKSAQPIMD